MDGPKGREWLIPTWLFLDENKIKIQNPRQRLEFERQVKIRNHKSGFIKQINVVHEQVEQ